MRKSPQSEDTAQSPSSPSRPPEPGCGGPALRKTSPRATLASVSPASPPGSPPCSTGEQLLPRALSALPSGQAVQGSPRAPAAPLVQLIVTVQDGRR